MCASGIVDLHFVCHLKGKGGEQERWEKKRPSETLTSASPCGGQTMERSWGAQRDLWSAGSIPDPKSATAKCLGYTRPHRKRHRCLKACFRVKKESRRWCESRSGGVRGCGSLEKMLWRSPLASPPTDSSSGTSRPGHFTHTLLNILPKTHSHTLWKVMVRWSPGFGVLLNVLQVKCTLKDSLLNLSRTQSPERHDRVQHTNTHFCSPCVCVCDSKQLHHRS